MFPTRRAARIAAGATVAAVGAAAVLLVGTSWALDRVSDSLGLRATPGELALTALVVVAIALVWGGMLVWTLDLIERALSDLQAERDDRDSRRRARAARRATLPPDAGGGDRGWLHVRGNATAPARDDDYADLRTAFEAARDAEAAEVRARLEAEQLGPGMLVDLESRRRDRDDDDEAS